MTHITNKPTPKLPKTPQPPLSYPGATADSDRAKKPALSEPSATDQELNPGDRVEGLGNFGKPTGEFGIVVQANEDDAIVKWDDDGRMRLHQPWLKKVSTFSTLHVHQSELDPAKLLSDVMIIADEVDAHLTETVRSLMEKKLPRTAA